jgi:EAL domain-containing protein (putative c-di-GMP-specific phosphodiesterase class I)/PleD family two-component response regulator
MTDSAGATPDDRRDEFLRYLAERTGAIGRRVDRFLRGGWDINGISLLHAEALRLGAESRRHDVSDVLLPLEKLAEALQQVLARDELPDVEVGGRVCELVQLLEEAAPEPPALPDPGPPPEPQVDLAAQHGNADVQQARAHAQELFRTSGDAWGDGVQLFGKLPSREAGSLSMPEARITGHDSRPPDIKTGRYAPITPARSNTPPPAEKTPSHATTVMPAIGAPTPPAGDSLNLVVPSDFRVYHLTGHGPLSLELDQRIESQGVEIELLEDVAELNELLRALPADLVLIDAAYADSLQDIGSAVRLARANNNKQRLLLVAFAEADDINLRLSARRAGVDALIIDAPSANEVIKKLQVLIDPKREDPFRIMIVEDDRSQALFAEGILRNAGMDSLVVLEAMDVMPSLKQFRPDLILMDLNMPGANGIELTALIREQDAFLHTPIVFLSGESSDDAQFDAIESGGDDFLTKPIRPRHLISAVQTRVRRARAVESRRAKRADKDAATGLVYRSSQLKQLDDALHRGQQEGGLLFIEVENLGPLRERIGLTALETLLGDLSRLLTATLGEVPATRFGDGSYLVIDNQHDEAALESLGVQLRQTVMAQPFTALGHPLRLRVSVGIAAFKHGFDEAGAMINAAEKIAREARGTERGVRRFEPPRVAEAMKEAALLLQVREAIDHDSLVMLYQPVVAVAGSDVSQYQALLRLRDSNGKLHSAAEIIPMAERSSLIVDIDRWVMKQSLALIREHLLENQLLRLYVAQSPLTLAAPDQAEWLRNQIAEAGVPGEALVVELRLDDAVVHASTVRSFCETMVAHSVQFCLSQFEAGSQAEELVYQLPLSYVKLARKYTAGTQTQELRDELKTLIGRAHRRGLLVIGHGVEDAQAAATLWMSGIDFIQGNLVQQADEDMNFDFNQAVL